MNSRISAEHMAKMREGRRIADAKRRAMGRAADPFAVADYCLEILRTRGTLGHMTRTIQRTLGADPDFALRFLRLVAELQRELGPTAGLGGQITINVTTNLDTPDPPALQPPIVSLSVLDHGQDAGQDGGETGGRDTGAWEQPGEGPSRGT